MFQAAADANYLNVPYLLFNYPGVGATSVEPRSFDELVESAIRVVKYATDELEYDSKNITLVGFSLGGAVAVKAANKLYKHDIPVRVIADRTFNAIKDKVPLIGGVIIPKEWNVTILDNYLNLPDSNKMAMNNRFDQVIPESISLVEAVRKRLNLKNVYNKPVSKKSEENPGDFVSGENLIALMTDCVDRYGSSNFAPDYCTHGQPWRTFSINDIWRPLLQPGEEYEDMTEHENEDKTIYEVVKQFIHKDFEKQIYTKGHQIAINNGWIN